MLIFDIVVWCESTSPTFTAMVSLLFPLLGKWFFCILFYSRTACILIVACFAWVTTISLLAFIIYCPYNLLSRVMKRYSSSGRRNHGRPLKRLLDMWDRNGSTSGPTSWQKYDDDDDNLLPHCLELIWEWTLLLQTYKTSVKPLPESMKNKSDQMKPSQYNNTSNLLLQTFM